MRKRAAASANVVISRGQRAKVFSGLRIPGIGDIRVMDRDTYERANRRAGRRIRDAVEGIVKDTDVAQGDL